MKRYEYMHLKLADIPEEIIEEYKLHEIVTDDSYVYCNKKRDVRLTTSRINSTRTLGAMTIKSGIQSKQNHSWPVDTRNKTNMLHVSC